MAMPAAAPVKRKIIIWNCHFEGTQITTVLTCTHTAGITVLTHVLLLVACFVLLLVTQPKGSSCSSLRCTHQQLREPTSSWPRRWRSVPGRWLGHLCETLGSMQQWCHSKACENARPPLCGTPRVLLSSWCLSSPDTLGAENWCHEVVV